MIGRKVPKTRFLAFTTILMRSNNEVAPSSTFSSTIQRIGVQL